MREREREREREGNLPRENGLGRRKVATDSTTTEYGSCEGVGGDGFSNDNDGSYEVFCEEVEKKKTLGEDDWVSLAWL
ncbi:hypothetical protein AHAS_Ahas10G0117100 [Arachis hypogaea]